MSADIAGRLPPLVAIAQLQGDDGDLLTSDPEVARAEYAWRSQPSRVVLAKFGTEPGGIGTALMVGLTVKSRS